MRKILTAAVAVLALGGCSSTDEAPSDDPTTDAPSTVEESELIDVTSGRPLSEFEGSPTYDWRKAIAEDPDGILGQLQAVAPHLEEKDFSDVLSTCDAIGRGAKGKQLVDQTVVRFSGAPSEAVTPDQAQQLIDISRAEVCP